MMENQVEAVEESLPKKKKKNKKTFGRGILVGILSTIAVLLLILIVAFYTLFASTDSVLNLNTISKINYLSKLLEASYYKDLDVEDLRDGLFKGLFSGAGDPYTVYYTQEEVKKLNEQTSGTFCGIGVLMSKDLNDGTITASKVYEDSPAEKAGVKEGDIFIAADDRLASSFDTLEDFVAVVRGEKGTNVVLTVYRDGEYLTLTATRDIIDYPTVEYQMLDDGIGYIAISSFAANTQKQFDEAVADLTAQGMTSVIFDLRSNGGGLVDSVVAILDEILPEGIVVYTLDKNGNRQDYTSDAEHYMDIPMVVLTDGNTASASEIFTAAIRDFGMGKSIGTTTYGKGIVQTSIQLIDGSAVKFTTSSYYTPKDICIQGEGIEPDVEIEYEFLGKLGDEYDVSLDNQIQKAIEVLKEQ